MILICFLIKIIFSSHNLQTKEAVLNNYLIDIEGDLHIDSLIYKYHPLALNDDEASKQMRSLMKGRREYLEKNSGKKLRIKYLKNEDLNDHPSLKGLEWQEGIYMVFIGDEEFMTILIQRNNIVSSVILSKGKKKYFLKI